MLLVQRPHFKGHSLVEWWTDLKICYIMYNLPLYLENPHFLSTIPLSNLYSDQKNFPWEAGQKEPPSFIYMLSILPLNNFCLVEKSLFPFLWWYNTLLIYFLPDPLNLFWFCGPLNSCFFPRDCFSSTKVFRSSNPFPLKPLVLYTNAFKICISISVSLLSFKLRDQYLDTH